MRRRAVRRAAPVGVAAALVLAAACGGSGGGARADEDAVRAVARQLFESAFAGDTAGVIALLTPCTPAQDESVRSGVGFLHTTSKAGDVLGVDVRQVKGDTAKVKVKLQMSSPLGGSNVDSPTFDLQRDSSGWKVTCASLAGSSSVSS